MSPSLFFSGLSRRTLLSAVATLSAFPGTLLPVTASAQTINLGRPTSIMERRRSKASDPEFRSRCNARGFAGFRASRRAHRYIRQ
jgi:hypothetical protein